MAGSGRLRDAGTLVAPGLERTLAAIGPPPADDALVSLARSLAATADAMPDALRPTMLPQLSGQLAKVLAELDKRHQARLKTAPAPQMSRLDQLRQARAASRRPGSAL